jgi:site-specific DNA-methyltransferase (adenine-specific)
MRNHHPTVKPTNLMQYLCRLVTPKNGLILDPFLGSGSTGKAAMYEGFRFIGFDLSQEYIDIAKARIEFAIKMKNESSGKKENTLFEDEE